MRPATENARDARDLAAVRMLAERIPFELMASRLGLCRNRANQITRAIKVADVTESGEPPARVLQHCWGQ